MRQMKKNVQPFVRAGPSSLSHDLRLVLYILSVVREIFEPSTVL